MVPADPPPLPERIATSVADGLPLTITEAAAALRDGRWTATALLEAVHQRADVLDGALGAFATRTRESAVAAAATADAQLRAGLDLGPLHGIPVAIKDVVATHDAPTRAQSRVLDPAFSSQGDAPAVSRLRDRGAVIVGKAVTMEYALGVPDPTKGHIITRNPFDFRRWPGGSSTGLGAGVQAGLFLGGLGSDTAGSIRIPASFCGISGLKPTFGRVPTAGTVPLAWSQDTLGPMARTASDCAVILAAIAGRHPDDHTSSSVPPGDYVAALTGRVDGLRIGVDQRVVDQAASEPDVAALLAEALAVLRGAGAHIEDVQLPLYDELNTVASIGMCTEALAYHSADLRRRWSDYGAATRASLALGALTTAADYIQAQRVRRVGIQAALRLFASVDLVVTPTTLVDAPLLEGLDLGGIVAAITTMYWSALGFPAMSIPMGLTGRGLPVGMQIAARPFAEAAILNAADAFQRRTWHHLDESPVVTAALA
jgi:aspartyl-tRNA(Asn)/glutamyl-tRNA(Gln) amidotransferase subunit A